MLPVLLLTVTLTALDDPVSSPQEATPPTRGLAPAPPWSMPNADDGFLQRLHRAYHEEFFPAKKEETNGRASSPAINTPPANGNQASRQNADNIGQKSNDSKQDAAGQPGSGSDKPEPFRRA